MKKMLIFIVIGLIIMNSKKFLLTKLHQWINLRDFKAEIQFLCKLKLSIRDWITWAKVWKLINFWVNLQISLLYNLYLGSIIH